MAKQKLASKDLRKIGFRSDTLKSLSINIMGQHYKHTAKQDQLNLLCSIAAHPERYSDHTILSPIAAQFITINSEEKNEQFSLKDTCSDYGIWGRKHIDSGTIYQMETAMRLPCVVAGALMPDAHRGYGIPIGGVVATKNEVIPYAVGVDIGCRMALTIFEESSNLLRTKKFEMKHALQHLTHFGNRMNNDFQHDHAILEDERFRAMGLLRKLHSKAVVQLGTSGSGNHFVEFGEVTLPAENQFGIPGGNYLGLLSHSGSRGLGASIAETYTRIAMSQCRLSNEAKYLAWLDLQQDAGEEYWLAMNLAGDYAKACHDVIHSALTEKLGLTKLVRVENHHNFAWQEMHPEWGTIVVHRKGATPAKLGELGIIPSSMTTPAYIVSGLGNTASLNSAAHGSGRKMSRSKAKLSFTKKMLREELKRHQATLIGGSADESPMAYKDGQQVMNAQTDLVQLEGTFVPKIIRMDND